MSKKILVVDDEKGIVDILRRFLAQEGFDVLTATDGGKALQIAKEFVPDLIILDIMMPGVGGGEVAEGIKEDAKLKDIPIVFLTGLVSDNESSNYNENSKGRIILSKSLEISEQVKAIKRILKVDYGI